MKISFSRASEKVEFIIIPTVAYQYYKSAWNLKFGDFQHIIIFGWLFWYVAIKIK